MIVGSKITRIIGLKINCRDYGQPACMVFDAQMAEGAKIAKDCPVLDEHNKNDLNKYLSSFKFDYDY